MKEMHDRITHQPNKDAKWKTAKCRVSDYVAEALVAAGAESFFLVSGGMIMHLMDAFGRTGLRYVCNHHEQASAMGADGFSRARGTFGVCLATSGPGATNLITGIAGAYQDSIPIMFLSGQNKLCDTTRASGIPGLRQAGVFEIDVIPLVTPITKYAAFVDSAASIRFHIEKALYLACSGRPGPVLLDIPLDVQAMEINPAELAGFSPPDLPDRSAEIANNCSTILDDLYAASRPLILAGNGIRISSQAEVLRNFVRQTGIPIVTSMLGKDLLPAGEPLLVGQLGTRGHRGANLAVQSADFIIALGFSFHIQSAGYERDLFAPNAKVVHIDPDRAVLQRNSTIADVSVEGSMRDYMPVLLSQSRLRPAKQMDDRWLLFCAEAKRRFCSRNEPHDWGSAADPCNLYEFIHRLSDGMKGDEILVTDAGQPTYIVPQGWDLKGTQRFLAPGSFAEMGWALPAAIGACIAEPDLNVVVILGDGSLQTNIQELQTVRHLSCNVKMFIINNGGYASIRNTQNSFFNGYYVASTPSSGVTLPEIRGIARAYNLPYLCCADRRSLDAAIAETLGCDGPVICEVMNRSDQKVLPTVPSFRLPDGTIRSRALHEMAPDIGVTLSSFFQEFFPDSD